MKKRVLIILVVLMFTMVSMTSTAFAASSPFTGINYGHQSQFKGLSVHNGIDVSKWQETINWSKVKNAGVEFAVLRCGYRTIGDGTINIDPMFKSYIADAKKNGIKVGVYFYSAAKTVSEAKAEAKKTLEYIDGNSLDLPVYYDLERNDRNDFLFNGTKDHKNTLGEMSKAFCKIVKDAGYIAGVYSNTNHFTNHIKTSLITDTGYEIWCAQYNTSNSYAGKFDMWQYSSEGSVNGIKGNVDCDFLYGNKYFPKASSPEPKISEPKPLSKEDEGSAAIEKVKKVTGVERKARSTSSYTIKWTGQKNAEGYYVYRSPAYNGTYKKIATTKNTYYKSSNLVSGKEYYYKVAAYNEAGKGEYSYKHAAMVKPSYDRYAVSTANKVIRTHAGTTYKKVYTVPAGKKMTVLGYTKDKDGNTWYRVKFKVSDTLYKGYIKNSYLEITKKGTTTADLSLRKKASTTDGKFGVIPSGTRIDILSIKTVDGVRWYKTTYEFNEVLQTGWIKGSYVKAINLIL